MTTPRDLMITALEVAPSRPAEQGELSLALAGAELVDLMVAGAAALEGDRIVPGHRTSMDDPLLEQAAESLVRELPYESVGDWLWRRGRGLTADYAAALEADGQLTRGRRGRLPFGTGRPEVADSLDRRLAAERWASGEPVLAALGTAVGIRGEGAPDAPGTGDDAMDTVLAAVDHATVELAAERQRRNIEREAFDNIWRGD